MSLTLEPSLIFWPILNHFPKNQLSQIRSFMVINDNQNKFKAVVITNKDKVFGFYHDADQLTKIVELGGGGGGMKIVQMCHCQKQVLALTNEGKVLFWNEDLIKQMNTDEIKSLLPTVIDFGSDASEPIAMIKCGMGHNLAVTKRTGKVYAWGNNKLGQCGVGNLTNQLIPINVIELEELVVLKVECGDNHSMALTDNGLVYSWGDNEFGQLGIGVGNNRSSPVKVTTDIGNDYPKDIACGSQHSLLLTEQGIVYGCGQNDVGQVGSGITEYINFGYKKPSFITTFVKVNIKDVLFMSIYAVDNVSVAISKSGLCYIWGACQDCQRSSPYNTNLFSINYVLGVHSPNPRISRLIQIAKQMSPLASALCESFDDPTLSDLKFVLNDRTIHVHRLLLQISSPYYQRMLSKDWLKSDSVEIDDYSYSVYYARLHYLYTGHFSQMDNLDEAIELFDLANCQLDYELRDLCISYLSEMVSIDNCCPLFNFTIQYKLDLFQQTISKFITLNLNNVIVSDSFKLITSDQCQKIMLSLAPFIKQ